MNQAIMTLAFSEDEKRKLENEREYMKIQGKSFKKWEDFVLHKCL